MQLVSLSFKQVVKEEEGVVKDLMGLMMKAESGKVTVLEEWVEANSAGGLTKRRDVLGGIGIGIGIDGREAIVSYRERAEKKMKKSIWDLH